MPVTVTIVNVRVWLSANRLDTRKWQDVGKLNQLLKSMDINVDAWGYDPINGTLTVQLPLGVPKFNCDWSMVGAVVE